MQDTKPTNGRIQAAVPNVNVAAPKSSNIGHGAPPLVPIRGAIREHPCVLSLESFHFHGILGEGSFGKVLLASHADIGQKLAVKIINKKRKILYDGPNTVTKERQLLIDYKRNRHITHLYGAFQTEVSLSIFYVFILFLYCTPLLIRPPKILYLFKSQPCWGSYKVRHPPSPGDGLQVCQLVL